MLPTGHYITEEGAVLRACPCCGNMCQRTDNECWSMTCPNRECEIHFTWDDGSIDDTYGHLGEYFGNCYVCTLLDVSLQVLWALSSLFPETPPPLHFVHW